MKHIWIIGGSSGIGLELVKIWCKENVKLTISSRNISSNETLVSLRNSHDNIFLLDIDVSKEIQAVPTDIDLLFYNVGVYEPTTMDSSFEDFENMINTNYLGFLRVFKKALKNMNPNSKIVANASLSSYFGLVNSGAYSASKSALVNLCQSFQPELALKGINLQVINHGFVKTRLTDKNEFEMPGLMTPKDTAKRIIKEINKSNKFEIRFPFKVSMFLSFFRFSPYRLSLYLNKKLLKNS
ncbi:MAG: Oxidoreductase, short chain dehydrogenase/reductase family [uncultured Campylobacterales bacterium]|uniref:Oxidoreductase, short chain dehydrogenase/reductase family n=1 Tax=uncultured Campylobacterales bacterium TaxID=352960 RepID=A0A6S6T9N2_9BACT|nr:MAG: Oxidoreductase, short chain dehydrogenase/reductase family [uncultured Campylobacterales bacterium]